MPKMTIQQIAELAEVNKATVSRVLNGNANISEKTRQKIERIMREHNYVPSSIARGLAFSKTFTVGFCFDYRDKKAFANPFFYKVLQGIEEVVYDNDYLFLMMSAHEKEEGKSTFERVVADRKVDGVLIPDTLLTRRNYDLLKEHEMPFVVIGENRLEGKGIHWVDVDNIQAGQLLTERLIGQGFRSIHIISEPGAMKRDKFIVDRIEGYTETMLRHGLAPKLLSDAAAFKEARLAIAGSGNHPPQAPDALICCTDEQLIDILDLENGSPLSSGLGLATFDEFPLSRYLKHPVHYVQIDLEEMGRKGAELLFALMNKEPDAPELIRIPTTKVN